MTSIGRLETEILRVFRLVSAKEKGKNRRLKRQMSAVQKRLLLIMDSKGKNCERAS